MSAPPTSEALLGMMRAMLTEDSEQDAMIFLGAEGQEIVVPCIEHPVEVLAMVNMAIGQNTLPKPDWIAVLCDNYSIAVPPEEMPVMRPGLLSELFAAGDPRVKETIMVMCLAPDGPTYASQQTYTRIDDDFDWDEPEELPLEQMGGAITNEMRRVLGMKPVEVH